MRDGPDHRQAVFAFAAGSTEPTVLYVCPRCGRARPERQWHEGVMSQCGVCRCAYQRTVYRLSATDRFVRRERSEASRQSARARWVERKLQGMHSGAGRPCCQA